MKLMQRMVKVLVTREEKERLDKWAIDTCYGELVREVIHIATDKTERVYRFRDDRWRREFIDGLNINFGPAVELL